MKEIWKPVSSCIVKRKDGSIKYEVSNLGRIRITDYIGARGRYIPEHIMCPRKTGDGTYSIRLTDELHRGIDFLVHRLVDETFIPNPNNFPDVSWLDGDRTNNAASNLYWRNDGRAVIQYDFNGNFVARFVSAMEASKANNCSYSSISLCCNGHSQSSMGYIWVFENEDVLVDMPVSERAEYIAKFMLAVQQQSVHRKRSVRQYTLDGKLVKEYSCLAEARKESGLGPNIGSCCRRYKGFKTAGGFIWRFAEDDEFEGCAAGD